MTNDLVTQELTAEQLAAMAEAATPSDFKSDDLALPWITVLQSMSPETKSSQPDYVTGAKEGDIFNSVTHELHDTLEIIPVHFTRRYTEWKPGRGGLARDHGADSTAYDNANGDFGTRTTGTGNSISMVMSYVVLAKFNAGWSPAMLTMGSTQMRKARRWNSLMQTLTMQGPNGTFTAPMFARSYTFSTVDEHNDKGTWKGWGIEPSQLTLKLPDGASLFAQAKELRRQLDEGRSTATVQQRSDDIPF